MLPTPLARRRGVTCLVCCLLGGLWLGLASGICPAGAHPMPVQDADDDVTAAALLNYYKT